MIGIGTPSNRRSAPLAMIASVDVNDNGATESEFRVLLIERRLATQRKGRPRDAFSQLRQFDGKGIEGSHKDRSKQLHVPQEEATFRG